MKKLLVAAAIAALVFSVVPSSGRSYTRRAVTFAASMCSQTCAYNATNPADPLGSTTANGCKAPAPAGSFQDRIVVAPPGANFLIVNAYPTVDWDIFLCVKPARGSAGKFVTYSANSVDINNPTATCPLVGCPEQIKAAVRAGTAYIIRAYNYSDPNSLRGDYQFMHL